MALLFEGFVDVHYGFVSLNTDEDDNSVHPDLMVSRSGQMNGLCGAAVPGALSLVTGLHTGEVPFAVEWYATEPRVGTSWEDVVEVSLDVASTRAGLSSFEAYFGLELPADGCHRVRYCASGMDAAREEDLSLDDQPAPDRYLMQLWPAPMAADLVVREGSQIAAYWHAEARKQPALSAQEIEELCAHDRPSDEYSPEIDWTIMTNEEVDLADLRHHYGDRPVPPDIEVVATAALRVAESDLRVLERLAALSAEDQRRAACWFARQAFAIAEIDDLDWVRPALAAMDAGQPLPPPFDDRASALARLRPRDRDDDEPVANYERVATFHVISVGPDRQARDDLPIHRPSFAIPALFATTEPDPLRAALETFVQAEATFHEQRRRLADEFLAGFVAG